MIISTSNTEMACVKTILVVQDKRGVMMKGSDDQVNATNRHSLTRTNLTMVFSTPQHNFTGFFGLVITGSDNAKNLVELHKI